MIRHSALIVGSVRHRRFRPRAHAFRHRTYHTLLDIDELEQLDRAVLGFGYARASLTSYRDSDHFGKADQPTRVKLERWLALQGSALPSGPVRVLTNLRIAGHLFNPVSWWFCHDDTGELVLVVAEVANTFGESYVYLLDGLRPGPNGTLIAATTKSFYVSPFLNVEGLSYTFTFAITDERILVHMDVHDANGKVLDATQAGRRQPFTSQNLLRTLLTHPLMTLRTVLLIYVHGLRLWWKRVPTVQRPPAPRNDFGQATRTERVASRGEPS